MPARNAIKGKHLYRILFFGVIFTVIALGALAYWGVKEIRRDAAVVAVENSARGLSGAVTVLINSVRSANDEIGSRNLFSLAPTALRTQFKKVFKEHQVVTAVMVADEKGLVYMLTRMPNGVLETRTTRGDKPSVARDLWKVDGSSESSEASVDFDRTVVDSGLAEEFRNLIPGKVSWRSTYRFHNQGESWITASTLAATPSGRSLMVSYVFPVNTIVSQLGGAEKGGAEKIFLFWQSGNVLPITTDETTQVQGDRASKAVPADKVEDPVIAGAAARLESLGVYDKPISYRADDEVWWAYVLPLPVFDDTMSIGVAIPLRNIVSTLTSDRFIQIFGGLLAFMAICSLGVLHRFRSRIESMGLRKEAARTAADVLNLIAEGESSRLEFKQTLRFNLKSGKNGKEIEHASVKTVAAFINSEGGTLLVGVADNGQVTGFAEDKLDSDDKALLHFNNLVNQHIGTEFSRYVDTAVIEVQGKHIIRAHCIPAPVPAILKGGKAEEFFVRSGPASRQLSLSQFYEWLQNH